MPVRPWVVRNPYIYSSIHGPRQLIGSYFITVHGYNIPSQLCFHIYSSSVLILPQCLKEHGMHRIAFARVSLAALRIHGFSATIMDVTSSHRSKPEPIPVFFLEPYDRYLTYLPVKKRFSYQE